MIKRIEYICEICQAVYDEAKEAEACEARGIPDTTSVPIGCMDGSNADPKSFYANMVFAAAVVSSGKKYLNPHDLQIGLWGCRDTPVGDNVGLNVELCGRGGHFKKGHPANIDVKAPATQRMFLALREMDIEPTVWDGEKAISWEEYRNNIGG